MFDEWFRFKDLRVLLFHLVFVISFSSLREVRNGEQSCIATRGPKPRWYGTGNIELFDFE